MKKKGSFPWRATATGVSLIGFGWLFTLPGWKITSEIGWVMILVGLVIAAAVAYTQIAWYRSTAATLARTRKRAEKHGGTISRREYRAAAGKAAVRKSVTTLLPESTETLGRLDRRRVPITNFATLIAKESRLGPIYSSCEDVTVAIGGPRRGKSTLLACFVADAPGAAVVTSTRPDLALWTMAKRQTVGDGVIHIFDPAGTSGLASTIKWPILAGCRDPRTALRRSRDMVPIGATAEHEKWNSLARRTLALLMHAAALDGLSMFDVMSWASRPSNKEYRTQVEDAIRLKTKDANLRTWLEMSNQFFGTNDRTQTSITTTLVSYLEWLMDPKASAAGEAVDGTEVLFDTRRLIDNRQTVYMIGEKDDGVAPLVAALTGEIAYQARVYAKARGGRLDPPLTIVLDEAANICPVPLPAWSSYMGGHNITLHIGAQDPAQLVDIWGVNGTSSILSHAGSLLVFGGIQDTPFLVDCCRKADILVQPKDGDGKVTGSTQVSMPVITPGEIMRLGKHQAFVFRAGISACIAQTPNIHKRKDIKRLNDASPYRAMIETEFQHALATEAEVTE